MRGLNTHKYILAAFLGRPSTFVWPLAYIFLNNIHFGLKILHNLNTQTHYAWEYVVDKLYGLIFIAGICIKKLYL